MRTALHDVLRVPLAPRTHQDRSCDTASLLGVHRVLAMHQVCLQALEALRALSAWNPECDVEEVAALSTQG
jgi:hypothetical protein